MFWVVNTKLLSKEEFKKLKENDTIFFNMNGHTFQTTVIGIPMEMNNLLFVNTKSGVLVCCGNAYVEYSFKKVLS